MFRLIVISFPDSVPGELRLLNRLFENGLESFHLRKPEMKQAEMRKLITRIPADFHQRLIIHSNYSLCNEFSLKGLHFPFTARNEMKRWMASGRSLSVSLHTTAEINEIKDKIDYAFLSPVFNSISKQNYKPSMSITEIRKILSRKHKFDIVALGGIEPETIAGIKDMGFNGAALLGSIWMPYISGMPESRIIEKFNQFRDACNN